MKAVLKISLTILVLATFVSVAHANKVEYKKLNQRMALLYKNGRNTEAIKTAKEVIKVAEETFGKTHAYYSSSLENLAMLHIAQSQYNEAVALYEQSLQVREGLLGKDSPKLIKVLEKMEDCYKELKKADKMKMTKDRIASLGA